MASLSDLVLGEQTLREKIQEAMVRAAAEIEAQIAKAEELQPGELDQLSPAERDLLSARWRIELRALSGATAVTLVARRVEPSGEAAGSLR